MSVTYSKSDRLWGLKWLKVKVRLTIPLGSMENILTLVHNATIKISKGIIHDENILFPDTQLKGRFTLNRSTQMSSSGQ